MADEPRSPRDDDADFDAIVKRLDLDLTFPDSPLPDTGRGREVDDEPDQLPAELDERPDDRDEQFYRHVEARPMHLPQGRRGAAIVALAAIPALLILCAAIDFYLPREVVLLAGVIFVGAAIYLIWQLPERGPAHPDSPDDGAAL